MKILFRLVGLLAVVSPLSHAALEPYSTVLSNTEFEVDTDTISGSNPVASGAVVHQDLSSGTQRGSSKCGAARLQTFFEEIVVPCLERAVDRMTQEAQQITNLEQVFDNNCKFVNERVNCWFRSETSVCLSNEEKNNGAMGEILTDFQFAYNKTRVSFLGDNYVASCTILRDNKDEANRRWTGSNKCDFGRIWRVQDEHFKCFNEANAEQARKLDSIEFASDSNKGNIFVDALCTSRETFLGRCMNILSPCFSSEVMGAFRTGMLEYLGNLEANIGNGFNFNRVCGPAPNGKRRRRSPGVNVKTLMEYLTNKK